MRFFSHVVALMAAAAVLPPSRLAALQVAGAEPVRQVIGAAVECSNGKAGDYECLNTELLAFLPIPRISGGNWASDIWGWTDSATGREFAIIGRGGGRSNMAFVDVTDPVKPRYLGLTPDLYPITLGWVDVKVYKNHAFIVAAEYDTPAGIGIHVFDLRQLQDVPDTPRVFQKTTQYDGLFGAHNLVINPETGYAYAVTGSKGSVTCVGGLHMIDLRNPVKPAFAGCYADSLTLDIHDAQCVVYRGPDRQYRGREICFNAAGNAVSIADVTDKKQPKTISIADYPTVGYAYQGWLSDDQRYFFLTDKLAKSPNTSSPTRTIVFDMRELRRPVVAKEFVGAPAGGLPRFADYTLYVRGRYLYQTSSDVGLRVIDVEDPRNPREVGYFDTTPSAGQSPGAGSAYPFFKSGAIGIANAEGLFLVRFTPPGPSRP